MVDKKCYIFIHLCLMSVMFIGLSCVRTENVAIDKAVISEVNRWKPHDDKRPLPPIVDPGNPGTLAAPGTPPSDSIILFDGSDLSEWQMTDGDSPKWRVENGFFEVVKKTGTLQTIQGFGDCQLHIEWASPVGIRSKGQGSGNSGVYLMGKYEIQVLNSYENSTYADGQAAAVYGQYPPLVNASRPPGEWQTYDIIFHRPRFDETGKLVHPARFTVFHNGVLVQDNVELVGPTEYKKRPPYKSHPDRLPLQLQDHGDPVRYRNIWIRDLEK